MQLQSSPEMKNWADFKEYNTSLLLATIMARAIATTVINVIRCIRNNIITGAKGIYRIFPDKIDYHQAIYYCSGLKTVEINHTRRCDMNVQ
jgi:hypothetical protein